METYSLLQTSLNQTIDRQAMEEASVAVRSIARADCARLQRELFGIVISSLSREDALAFQAELARRNFPTEMVADRELPVLHESLQIQRIEHRDEVLVFTDALGREQTRPVSDLVFLAGGFLNKLEFKTESNQHFEFGTRPGMPRIVTERKLREQEELSFRLDFFFWSDPNRLHARVGKEAITFFQGKPLRIKDRATLRETMTALATLLPPERLNQALHHPDSQLIYPNVQCYEEELRWHFHHFHSKP